MNRRRKVALIWTFAVFFAVVGLQTAWPILPEPGRLAGYAVQEKPVGWNWTAIRNGETTKRAESWFSTHVGFRHFWVGLDNQVSYSLFGEMRPQKNDRTGTRIVAGQHDWLFEYHYVDDALRNGGMDLAILEAKVNHLKSVQAKLAKRGIPLLLVVAPSKAEVYPEHIPPGIRRGRSPDQFVTDFERVRELLRAKGVSFYDGPKRFLEWKAAGQRNLFARSGSHWSYVTALQVLQEIRAELNPRMKRPIPEFTLTGTPLGRPRATDADLIELTNLLVSAPYEHDIPYPMLVAQAGVPVENLPKILWVHDSFAWILHDLMYAANAMQPTESLYYYNRAALGMPGRKALDLDPETGAWVPSAARQSIDDRNPRLQPAFDAVSWNNLLKTYDAVVVVFTEIAVDDFSWGFLEQLDRALD